MIARRHFVLALVSIFVSMGASYRTTNFVVHAPTEQIAQRMGQLAERYRREKAIQWLGYEMPPWPQPCPLDVRIGMNGPSGATSFNFNQYGPPAVLGQHMQINGPLDRLMASVLPHEITHTVFAHHFKRPVPRWADEGGSVLSEDDAERARHNKLTRQILNANQQIPLRTLLRLTEYPNGKVMHLYAQGYSLSEYLVNYRGDRRLFLKFVAMGMQNRNSNWDQAAWTCYRHRSVEELEQAWLKHLRDTKGQDHIQLARNRQRRSKGPAQGTVVRMTVPPSPSFQPAPTFRGQSPEEDNGYGSRPAHLPTARQPNNRPGYLPDYSRPINPNWQAPQTNRRQVGAMPPRREQPNGPVPVQLGAPQFDSAPVGPVRPASGVSPVGFPR